MMMRRMLVLVLLLVLGPSCILAVDNNKLRTGHSLVAEDEHDERRRMEEIAFYWTPERIRNATPKDFRKPGPVQRRLHVLDEDRVPVPYHLEHDDRYLLSIRRDGGSLVECTVRHEPSDTRSNPTDTSAPALATVPATASSRHVDLVVHASHVGQGLSLILQYSSGDEEQSVTTETHFDHHHQKWGPGRYTFTLGPLPEGDYRWTAHMAGRQDNYFEWGNFEVGEDEEDVPTHMRGLGGVCSGLKKGDCRQSPLCRYKRKKCQPKATQPSSTVTSDASPDSANSTFDVCSMISKKRMCRKSPAGCTFKHKRCVKTDPADSCSKYSRKKACRKAPECKFENKKCVSASNPTPPSPDACNDFTRRKACRKAPGCKFENRKCMTSNPLPTSPFPDPDAAAVDACSTITREKGCRKAPECFFQVGKCVKRPTPSPTPVVTFGPTSSPTEQPTLPPQPILPQQNPDFLVDYILPSFGGGTTDPVAFKWKVTPKEEPEHILIMVEFPDGSTGYVSRDPSRDGRDGVDVSLDQEGNFRWAIWGEFRGGRVEKGPWSPFEVKAKCSVSLDYYRARHQDLHKAVGRILYRDKKTQIDYLCTGTLVEGFHDRALVITAAHCIFDRESQSFPDKVIFIPGQDDGGKDKSDYRCSNDPHGCFYPKIGVVSDKYRTTKDAEKSFQFDYGFYVAPDTDGGVNSGPDRATYGGRSYESLVPMGITFDGIVGWETTYLFGYPGSHDASVLYTEGLAEPSPIDADGWYVDCSGLSSSASGGPWFQSDPALGRMAVAAVNSWGWNNGDPGMGSAPFDTGGAECVYNAANAANMNGGHVVAPCPK